MDMQKPVPTASPSTGTGSTERRSESNVSSANPNRRAATVLLVAILAVVFLVGVLVGIVLGLLWA